jgi:predicted site-specific integrase-resolvase
MNRFVKIGEAARILGVTPQTLRRWEREGRLSSTRKAKGQTRYYDLACLLNVCVSKSDLSVGYARVSSHDQKADLQRQAEVLSCYCVSKGWTYEILQDLGSGMNYRKKGLKHLINLILEGKMRRLVLTHKDRLLRFGAELIFSLCEVRQIEVVVINQGEDLSFEEELAQDVMEMITVFSARLYGSRSRRNQKLIEAAKVLINDEG